MLVELDVVGRRVGLTENHLCLFPPQKHSRSARQRPAQEYRKAIFPTISPFSLLFLPLEVLIIPSFPEYIDKTLIRKVEVKVFAKNSK